jgi:hypothetical protein
VLVLHEVAEATQTTERNIRMTEEERNTINVFKAGISLLKTGPHGWPLPGQELERETLFGLMTKVGKICDSDPDTPEKAGLRRLRYTTACLFAAADLPDRLPDVPERWFKARAELVEPADD